MISHREVEHQPTTHGQHSGLAHPMSMHECSSCSLPICEQLVLKVNESYFHGSCLNCSECQMKLHEKCYARDGGVYCKEDFFKKFGTMCASCGERIPSSEVVRRANQFVYHLNCFVCLLCYRPLKTGDEFYLIDEQKLVCKLDYDALRNKEFDESSKRPRTTITQKQLEILKRAYHVSVKPPRHVREALAAETGLDMRVVQVWFQNRRAKDKRLNKDSGRAWSNVKRGAAANERANSRMTANKTRQFVQGVDGSSESDDDAVLSYDESSDDPSSHVYNSNVRSRSSHLTSMDSSYNHSSGLFTGPSHTFASSLNINDDHSSPSELDFCSRLTTTNRPGGFNPNASHPRRANHPSLMAYAQ